MSATKAKNPNYRYSIIPAAAITDPNITAQALRVLALLGRHTDDNGWCRRSQVRMAKELGCSRGTVQNALDLLIGPDNGAGYVERREETRPGVEFEEGRHPHCSYSYRVRLDIDDGMITGANRSAPPVPTEKHGVPTQDQHPVPISLAPLTEPSPLEDTPCEPSLARREEDVSPLALEKGAPPTEIVPGWPDIFAAFCRLPNQARDLSEPLVMQAWLVLPDHERPTAAEMVRCIDLWGEWLVQENVRRARAGQQPHFVTAPQRWIKLRKFAGFLREVRGGPTSVAAGVAKAAAKPPASDTLSADVFAGLRRARLEQAQIDVWFSGATCVVAASFVDFTFPRVFERNWVSERFRQRIQDAFKCEVRLHVAGERSVAA